MKKWRKNDESHKDLDGEGSGSCDDVTTSRVKFNSWSKLWEFQGGMVDSYESQERRQGSGC